VPILSVQFQAQMQPGALLHKEGPKVPVEVRVPAELEVLLQKESKPVPSPVRGLALIDTGATLSMIDEEAIQHLCVSPVGSVVLGTAGGAKQSALYPVRLAIVIPPNPPVVAAQIAQITCGPLKPQGLLCLLGRDLLQHALFVYDGASGRFTIAF
jgi:hypothetical protein